MSDEFADGSANKFVEKARYVQLATWRLGAGAYPPRVSNRHLSA